MPPSVQRMTFGVVLAAVAIALLPSCSARSYLNVTCEGMGRRDILHLVTQAVPSATLVPCIERLPTGWTYGGSEVRSGFAHFWLNSDRVGVHAVDVTLTATCDVAGEAGRPVPGENGVGLWRYRAPPAEHPGVTIVHYVATGGCATVRYSFTRQAAPWIYHQAQSLLGYNMRSGYVASTRNDTGLTLCGAEAPPCPG